MWALRGYSLHRHVFLMKTPYLLHLNWKTENDIFNSVAQNIVGTR